MIAVLILNPDCSVSALCEVEQYLHFQYQEKGRVVIQVFIHPDYFDLVKKRMWEQKQNVYVMPDTTSLEDVQKLLPKDSLFFWCNLTGECPDLVLPF